MTHSDKTPYAASAYGGENWSPRTATHRDEIGTLWAACGIDTEWRPLQAVLMHPPGAELAEIADPDAVQMLAPLDLPRARQQHAAIVQAYRDAGVAVHLVEPDIVPSPNLMFCADLLFATPEGVILGRPASTVRAGEERYIARRLAALGIPIVRTLRGNAVFEGADAAWLDPRTVLLGRGLRTNAAGVAQVSRALHEMGVETLTVDLPYGSMHLMGVLRFLDRDLAIAWPGRLGVAAVHALQNRGYTVHFLPDEGEAVRGAGFNFVTLGPREILMAAGNPVNQAFYEGLGIVCHTVEVDELIKAAGAIGCLTGALAREIDKGK